MNTRHGHADVLVVKASVMYKRRFIIRIIVVAELQQLFNCVSRHNVVTEFLNRNDLLDPILFSYR